MIEKVCIGEISNVHGIKGQVLVRSFAENVEMFTDGTELTDKSGNNTFTFTKFAPHKNSFLATLEGIETREAAEEIKGTKIYIDRDALPETQEDEAYYVDLIGLNVIEDGQAIGGVIAVQNFGASDLLEIKRDGARNIYLPYTDKTILKIDGDDIHVRFPGGLKELYE
jgi:16S rRNA processing protein RimM